MVSLPLSFGSRRTEYLDRIWGNFYVYIGSVLVTPEQK
jgi:hypothetical protein